EKKERKKTQIPANGHSSKQTATTSGAQSNSKSSTHSEMDVSSPFADLKQISVQNKPLGGKKIQLQNTNPFSATKYGLESKQISTNSTVTKYASVSNGTLTNANTNGLNNSTSLTGVVNGNGTTSTNLTSNLMRSLLSSSNKSGNRNYFNHLGSSNTNNNNISNNSLNTNSTNNIFVDNDLSTYSLLPSDSYKNNYNNSTYLNGNNSIITATMPMHQSNGYSAIRGMQSREKTIAQINQNSTERTSKDSKVNNNVSNVRKENSFYVNSKENNSNGNVSIINGKDKHQHHSHQTQMVNANTSQIDANSIIRSSNLNHSRSVLSSKQLNNQTPIINHHKKEDCLTSTEALQLYGDKLTDFEKQEINEYAEIWYLGLDAEKINAQNVKDYDDENGAYIKVNKDHVAYRYEVIETLGKGSFGQVLKCFDHKRKEHVAVKIIRSKKRFQQQGMVEVNILQHLKNLDHDNGINVVHMKEYFYFRNHLCISFEILGINLYELIKKNNYQGFSIHLVRRFAYSILQCMKVMYRENIIHCDMKPENILLRQKGSSAIKVIDFGSGCFETQRIYTYIQSRFYRAPEIILGIPYTTAIDMWSFGCILVELFTGYPIFPGENEAEQLAMIMEVIDLPPAHILAEASRRKLFFDSKNMPRNLNTKLFKKRRVGSKSLAQILKTNDTNFIDFISRCLEWDPSVRMNAEDALKHPWILELKKKSSKDIRPKHRHRREAETSIEHDNTHYANNDRSYL
ncbi:unnamed protein product, partial [Brachionus calyciflorus]